MDEGVLRGLRALTDLSRLGPIPGCIPQRPHLARKHTLAPAADKRPDRATSKGTPASYTKLAMT
jgi:hypothetical protein